jgi:hypothetical protein
VEATTRQLIPKCREQKGKEKEGVGAEKKSNKKDRIEGEKTKNATHIYNLQKSNRKKKTKVSPNKNYKL